MQNQKGSTSIIVSIIILICAVGAGVYLLSNRDMTKDVKEEVAVTPKEEESNITTNPTEENKSEPTKKPMDTNKRTMANFKPVASTATLTKTDLVVGTGAEVKAGATVSVHYTGAIAATGEIFQSSKDFGTEPITFPLGGVIKGWTDGIPGMKVGGTRRLVIPAVQAYGATPPPGSGIPANADLVFDVELVAVK